MNGKPTIRELEERIAVIRQNIAELAARSLLGSSGANRAPT
jgi:uncharacterized small protein (DUF1192 family)